MILKKIVLTGGPCGGKSTALGWIKREFTRKGWNVVVIPETATELINSGLAPINFFDKDCFEENIAKIQIEKEKRYVSAAKELASDKVLIVCDRGVMDNIAYTDYDQFVATVRAYGYNEIFLRDNYDAVFHLVSAAKGAEEAYTLENNAARTETIEEAAALDDRFISAWTGHPHLRVIDNSTDFKGKMQRLIAEISAFLGEPDPYEMERKFLIRMPDKAELASGYSQAEILQTYLKCEDEVEKRVRQRGDNNHYSYYLTTKINVDNGLTRIEKEKMISRDEYLNLLMDADTTRHAIRKTRYSKMWGYQYIEIDIYPFWKNQAVLEVEVRNKEEEIILPPGIEIIREVTTAAEYKNGSLSRYIPPEEIYDERNN